VNRATLVSDLNNYVSPFGDETDFKHRFITLLEHPRAFHRDHLPGHITGSAFIIDSSASFTLLTHHAKLNRWLQPGGHADGEEDVLNVALREAREETGLKTLKPAQQHFFDIDIHSIPTRKDFPQHDHYDLRYLIIASMEEPFIVTEESHDLRWVSIHEIGKYIGSNASIQRMAEKAIAILKR
jgi:8-oxo-dGTP pyrophosphatase MutT (NUDIX family)